MLNVLPLIINKVLRYNLSFCSRIGTRQGCARQIYDHRFHDICANMKHTTTEYTTTQCFKKQYFCKLSSYESLNCWKCGTLNTSKILFCRHCNVLQKPNPKLNYFNVIEIEEKFEIETTTLTKNYHRLQNVLHPDRFSNRLDEEIKISEEYSSLVNKAYFTLLQPLSRALYMLKMKGIYIEEMTKQSSPEFLMEIMEENEEVDQVNNSEEIRKLTFRNRAKLNVLEKELANAFNVGNMKQAEAAVIKMKYYASVANKIKDIKQKKGLED